MSAESVKKSRNWWKLAFFAALVAFEFAREEAVVEANEPTNGNLFDFQSNEDSVFVQGQWFRSDSGSPLVPNSTAIQCNRETMLCIEASASVFGNSPRSAYTSISTYAIADFTDTSLDYVDESPICVVQRVHFDLVQKRVTATTEKKETTEKFCTNIEGHMARELSDVLRWHQNDGDWMHGHFLPLLRLIRGT